MRTGTVCPTTTSGAPGATSSGVADQDYERESRVIAVGPRNGALRELSLVPADNPTG